MNVLVFVYEESTGIFTIQKFDKRRELPFTYTQYIKFNSNRPIKQAYNVIISQTIPILYLSNDINLVLREINTLISTLVGNGFRKAKLIQIVIHTLTRTEYPAVKFKVTDLVNLLQGNHLQCTTHYSSHRKGIGEVSTHNCSISGYIHRRGEFELNKRLVCIPKVDACLSFLVQPEFITCI